MFVFEGNAVVVNIRAETINQHKYPTILFTATAAVISLFIIFATVGYSVYKDDCDPIFVLNFNPMSWYVATIIFGVCINCFISYPIQILAAFDILEQNKFFTEGGRIKLKKVICRSAIIIFVSGLAMVIPDFTTFLNIAGSLGAGVIAFVLPPMLYNQEFRETIPSWKKYCNWGILVFGIIGIILSLYNSIKAIVDEEE